MLSSILNFDISDTNTYIALLPRSYEHTHTHRLTCRQKNNRFKKNNGTMECNDLLRMDSCDYWASQIKTIRMLFCHISRSSKMKVSFLDLLTCFLIQMHFSTSPHFSVFLLRPFFYVPHLHTLHRSERAARTHSVVLLYFLNLLFFCLHVNLCVCVCACVVLCVLCVLCFLSGALSGSLLGWNKAFSHKESVEGVACDWCGLNPKLVDVKLSKCSRCLSAHYCSRECQLRHWNQHKVHHS